MNDLKTVDLKYILACEDIGELVEISKDGGAIAEAMWKSNKFRGTPKYYQAAKAALWAEWRAGHNLRESNRTPGQRTDLTLSQGGTRSPGFYALIEHYKLAKTVAYRWIDMSFAPRDKRPPKE